MRIIPLWILPAVLWTAQVAAADLPVDVENQPTVNVGNSPNVQDSNSLTQLQQIQSNTSNLSALATENTLNQVETTLGTMSSTLNNVMNALGDPNNPGTTLGLMGYFYNLNNSLNTDALGNKLQNLKD